MENRSLTNNLASYRMNILSETLPQLEAMSHKRQLLVKIELRMETVHRKIAIQREILMDELDKIDGLFDDNTLNIKDQRLTWRSYSGVLKDISSKIAEEQAELEPLQVRHIQTQAQVEEATKALYASLTGGVRPGDSVMSLGDQLWEAFATAFSPVQIETLPPTDQNSAVGKTLAAPDSDAPQNAISLPVQDFDHRDDTNVTALKGPLSDLRNGSPRRRSPDAGRAPSREPTQPSTSRWHDPCKSELAFCGHHFPSDDLEQHRHRATRDKLLFPDPLHLEARREDLRTLLGYDVLLVDPGLARIKKLEKAGSIGVSQKLTNIKVPTIHRSQLISLWARDMSQNAAVEAIRTLLYGNEVIETLIRPTETDPLRKFVQDVRKLKVPLQMNDAPQLPFITVATNNEVHSTKAVVGSGEYL